ncbi:FliM/FliN family flagellar motor switch protein [Brevundimonas faecalis]|uniref:FliM/FliN family flagellar motor switch protein n=1 Tax=Brevundimonas faecalis TaxID=947378 RepID=UPI00361AA790
MIAAQPWVPGDACLSPRTTDLLNEALATWSERWFKAGRFEIERGGQERAAPRPRTKRIDARWGWIETAETSHSLAALALDAPLDELEISAQDQAAIDTLEEAMLKDLTTKLGLRLPEGRDETVVRFSIQDDHGRKPMSIIVRRDALIGLLFKTLPAPRPVPPLATTRRHALTSTPVSLRAVIGAVSLRLEEAADLKIGDVVMLDRLVADAARLGVDVDDAFLPALSAEVLDPGPAAVLKLQPLVA